MTRRLAIIPARAGSKRIPGKNVRQFFGKPIISYGIEAAKSSGLFADIHVSTDGDEIVQVAEQFGVAPEFKRPGELCDDHTPILPVVRFVVAEYQKMGKIYDTVCMIYATSPLIHSEDLIGACKEFEHGDRAQPVLSVAPFPCPIEWAFRIDPNGKLVPCTPGGFAIRSQDLEPAYFDAAMFCFYSSSFILSSTGPGGGTDFRGYAVDAARVIDIDTQEQWDYAETVYKVLNS